MVILELYSTNLKTRYRNYLCSKASLVVFIIYCVNIVFPFILCYRSRGFWLKNEIFYEQPDIRFKGEFIFIGYTNNISFPIICSNVEHYSDLNNEDSCMLIQEREVDADYDGIIDELTFELNLILPRDTSIVYFSLILPIDYKLHTTCPMHMQSIIFLQETVSDLMNVISLTSILELSQRFPLRCFVSYINRDYNNSIFGDLPEDVSVKNIVQNFNKRNLTTSLKNIHKTYQIDSIEKFIINLNVLYPEHRVYYRTGFWQIIKFAWIQYLSIYIVLSWLTQKIKDYIFDNDLVLFYKVSPINKTETL